MAKYRRRAVNVEAFQWNGSYDPKTIPKWFTKAEAIDGNTVGSARVISNDIIKVLTLDGVMTARKGDYIIKAGNEIYPLSFQVFGLLFETIA